MNDLTVKKALEIKADKNHCWEEMCCDICAEAKGFLAAVEKFEPVVEALENSPCLCESHKNPFDCPNSKALSVYRRNVLGKNE